MLMYLTGNIMKTDITLSPSFWLPQGKGKQDIYIK